MRCRNDKTMTEGATELHPVSVLLTIISTEVL